MSSADHCHPERSEGSSLETYLQFLARPLASRPLVPLKKFIRHDEVHCDLRRDSSRSFGMTRLAAIDSSFRAPARNPGLAEALANAFLAVSLTERHTVLRMAYDQAGFDVAWARRSSAPTHGKIKVRYSHRLWFMEAGLLREPAFPR